MKFVVVIPTYNEAGNVEKLVRIIEQEFLQIFGHEMEVLFVDANSPDGTSEIIKNLQKEFTNVHLLVEDGKRGLGAAYIDGMKKAMKALKADVVIEMDADFQHSPADLKRFVVQIDSGADYVLGSRLLRGGSIPQDWGWRRKFWSLWGNLFSQIVLRLPSVTDYTTGFKASRVKGFLDKIELNNLASRGFAYKIHLLSEMVDLGAKVKEIPINFANREEGISKMEGNNPWDSLKVVLKIRLKKSARFLKFGLVGFLGLIIDFFLYVFLVKLFRFHPSLSSIFSAEAAIISNYYFNNRWTFADRKHTSVERFLTKFLHFNLASAFGVVFIRSGTILLLTTLWGNDLYIFFYFVSTSLLVVFNFTVYNRVIWRVKS